jgi:hypothetical protein
MTDQTSTSDDEAVQTRPFADVLQSLNKGRVHSELSDALQQLVAAVKETGKKGSISLTLTVAPVPKSDGLFDVADNVVLKAPKPARKSSFFYADDEANLVRNNPNQDELPGVRVVDSTAPLRKDA